MLELGQAQLATGETDLGILTLRRLERRAGDERRHDDRLRALLTLAEAQVGIAREAALGCARQIKAVSPLASDHTLASTAAIRAGIIELHVEGWSDEMRIVAWRRGGSCRVRPRTNIARWPSGCCSSTRRGRRTRTPGAPDAGCCRKPWRAATSPTAPTAITCWGSPHCTSAAGTRRRPSPPKAPRSASARAAFGTPSRCGCCRRGSPSKRSASRMPIESAGRSARRRRTAVG